MIKKIKGSDKQSDAPGLLNKNFEELNQRLKAVERKLGIKPKKN